MGSPFAVTTATAWLGGQASDSILLHNTWLQPVAVIAAYYWGGPWGAAAASAHLSRLSGGSWEDALRAGAISFASSYAFNYGDAAWSGVENNFIQGAGRALTAGAIGGGTAEAFGGRFRDGFWFAFGASAASSIYQSVVRYRATWQTGGDAVQKTQFSPPVQGANNFGVQGDPIANPGFWAEGGKLSRFFNHIPGMNAVAGMHDEFQIQFSGFQRSFFNVPLMIPAAAITVPALLASAPFQIVYDES